MTGNSVGVSVEKGSKLSKSGEIRDILQDRTLRGSIYSTLRCQTCGEKLKAENSVDNKFLRFYCTNYDCNDNSATMLGQNTAPTVEQKWTRKGKVYWFSSGWTEIST